MLVIAICTPAKSGSAFPVTHALRMAAHNRHGNHVRTESLHWHRRRNLWLLLRMRGPISKNNGHDVLELCVCVCVCVCVYVCRRVSPSFVLLFWIVFIFFSQTFIITALFEALEKCTFFFFIRVLFLVYHFIQNQ